MTRTPAGFRVSARARNSTDRPRKCAASHKAEFGGTLPEISFEIRNSAGPRR